MARLAFRGDGSKVYWVVLFIALILWLACGSAEGNWLIPLAAILTIGVTVAVLLSVGLLRRTIGFVAVGYLLRTVICILAWYQGKGTEYQYWTGLNDDSDRFFLYSYLPISEAVLTNVDPGFPIMNSVITGFAERFGQDHYLVNVQLPLVCGVFFALVTYLWGCRLLDEKCARLAGWSIALHPIVVGWSAGLMRDTVVCATGWTMVYAISRVFGPKPRRLYWTIPLSVASGWLTWSTRNLTFFYLLMVGLVFLAEKSIFFGRYRAVSWTAALAGTVFAVILTMRTNLIERFNDNWLHGTTGRAEVGTDNMAVNRGGLSAGMAESGSYAVYVLAAPYAFIAPFPVYAKPVGFDGEPGRTIDYLFSFGGLVNLFVFIYLFCGPITLWRERKWSLLVLSGPVFYVVCVLGVLVLAQSRWIMGLTYPIVFLVVAHVGLQIKAFGSRLKMFVLASLVVLLTYAAYWLLKAGQSLVVVAGTIGFILVVVWTIFLWQFYLMSREQTKVQGKWMGARAH